MVISSLLNFKKVYIEAKQHLSINRKPVRENELRTVCHKAQYYTPVTPALMASWEAGLLHMVPSYKPHSETLSQNQSRLGRWLRKSALSEDHAGEAEMGAPGLAKSVSSEFSDQSCLRR